MAYDPESILRALQIAIRNHSSERERVRSLRLRRAVHQGSLFALAVGVGVLVLIVPMGMAIAAVEYFAWSAYNPLGWIILIVTALGSLDLYGSLVWHFEWLRCEMAYCFRSAAALRPRQLHDALELLSECLRSGRPYGLYFRNFDIESFSEANGRGAFDAPASELIPPSRQADVILIEAVCRQIPVFCIGNLDDAIPSRSLNCFYVAGEDWIDIVRRFVIDAPVILVIAQHITPGLELELTLIADARRQADTVIVANVETARVLQERFPSILVIDGVPRLPDCQRVAELSARIADTWQRRIKNPRREHGQSKWRNQRQERLVIHWRAVALVVLLLLLAMLVTQFVPTSDNTALYDPGRWRLLQESAFAARVRADFVVQGIVEG